METKVPATGRSGIRLFFSSSILLFVIAHFAHHLVNALTTPLLPFIQDEFNLDYTQAGFVISAFSISYGLSQLPAGWLTDHIGARIMITISIIGVAIAGVLVGLSTNYIMLLFALIVMGIIGGGYHPSAPPLVMAATEPKNRSKALGFHMIGGSASHFLSPLVGGAIAAVWGWRASYIGLAIPMLIFGVIFFIILGRQNSARRAIRIEAKESVAVEADAAHTSLRRIIFFILLVTLAHAFTMVTVSFTPLFLVYKYGIDRTVAAGLLSLIFSSGLWASPLGGYFADRVGQMPVILIAGLCAGPIIFLMNYAPYGIPIFALLILLGMIGPMRNPASEGYIASNTPLKRRSTVLGFYYFGNMETGALLMPLVGYLLDHAPEGISKFAFAFNIVAVAVMVISIVFLVSFWGQREKDARAV
ncbi:MAG: MFS transporter [Chloroflexota bacterium]